MNKTIIGTVAAAAAAMGLLACDGIGGDRTTETKNMTIESKINAPKLGLFVINPNSAPHNYVNMLMEKGGDGIFLSADKMLWQNKITPVEVIAYAPFLPDCMLNRYAGEVAADQSRESDLVASDLVFEKRTVDPSADLTASGAIALALDHRLSKLEVSVAIDATIVARSADENPIESIEIRGTKRRYTFDLSVDEIQTTGGVEAVVPFDTSIAPWGGVASYEAILVPQTVGAGQFSVVMRVLGQTYTYTVPSELTLESNTRYNLSITITADRRVWAKIERAEWGEVIEQILTPQANEKIEIDLQKSVIPSTATVDAAKGVINVSRLGMSDAKIVFTGDFDKDYDIIIDHNRFYIDADQDTKYKNSSFEISTIQTEYSRDYQVKFRVTNVLFPFTGYLDVTINVAAGNGN